MALLLADLVSAMPMQRTNYRLKMGDSRIGLSTMGGRNVGKDDFARILPLQIGPDQILLSDSLQSKRIFDTSEIISLADDVISFWTKGRSNLKRTDMLYDRSEETTKNLLSN